MIVGVLFLIMLVVLVIGAAPTWPHSRNWGYYPSSSLGIVFVTVLLLIGTHTI
jgi:hypothetical protein